MSGIIKINTRANWSATNPVLLPGELAVEMPCRNVKIGNGVSNWNKLEYFGSPGYWGSFYDSTSQTATVNTPTSIYLRQTDPLSNGVIITNQTRMTFQYAGIYSITYSIQFSNTDTSIHDINVWLRKNDSGSSGDVPASDSRFSIISSHGGIPGNVVGSVNYVLSLVENDYLELIWSTSNVQAFILAEPAETTPVNHPSIPGVICTAVQIASN